MVSNIQDLTSADSAAFLVINNLAVPHVNALDETQFDELVSQSWWCKQVVKGENMQAILLVLQKGENYQSVNYRWFSGRYDHFAYVDRIIVAESARGEGLARQLYEALFDAAKAAGLERVCCEVNLEPPNPGSLTFHEKLGFKQVGEQNTEGGKKKVSLLIKELNGIS